MAQPSTNAVLTSSQLASLWNQSSNTINHYSHEGAKLNVLWTPTSKDILEVDAMQTYTRNHFTHSPAEYVRAYHLQADYTRTLGENGSSILFTLGVYNIRVSWSINRIKGAIIF